MDEEKYVQETAVRFRKYLDSADSNPGARQQGFGVFLYLSDETASIGKRLLASGYLNGLIDGEKIGSGK